MVSQSLAYGLTETAHLTVIMDTVRYDGREHRYVDYPIADLLQMMGRSTTASAVKSTQPTVCVLLCPASKKE